MVLRSPKLDVHNKAPRDQVLELVEMATAILDGTYIEGEYKCTL